MAALDAIPKNRSEAGCRFRPDCSPIGETERERERTWKSERVLLTTKDGSHDHTMSISAKDLAKSLMAERDKVDEEIKGLLQVLDREMVGEKGPLVDKEGFPRSDVDVARVRQDRNRLAMLYNDHKELSKKVEEAILQVHAEKRTATEIPTNGSAAPPPARVTQEEEEKGPQKCASQPFAIVDDVLASSPTEEAGLRVGDQIVSFGDIGGARSFGGNLMEIVEHARLHENSKVPVDIIRAGERLNIGLIPKQWSGNGLLGCHMRKM